MKPKTLGDIDGIAVIGIDIGKDTFHLVGFTHSQSGLAAARARGKKLARQPGQRPNSDKLAPKVLQAVAEGRSYRWIAGDLGILKNTVTDTVRRHRQNAL